MKPAIAVRYGVNTVMPEETRKGVDAIKKGETDKRKKVWEEKEGPATKRQKKMTAAQEEKGALSNHIVPRYRVLTSPPQLKLSLLQWRSGTRRCATKLRRLIKRKRRRIG